LAGTPFCFVGKNWAQGRPFKHRRTRETSWQPADHRFLRPSSQRDVRFDFIDRPVTLAGSYKVPDGFLFIWLARE